VYAKVRRTETNGALPASNQEMQFRDHARITGVALKRWFFAQLQDAACVAVLWLIGLLIIGVPWAPAWALLAAVFQFVPHLGPVISLIGPAIAATVSGGFMSLIYVFMLYAVIAVVDGLVLQPYLMRRTARVPIWASILTPIVLGLFLSFWGVLLAAPILAIIYAYRSRNKGLTADSQVENHFGHWTNRTPPM
jgi:predicted PurR-regulated permease PerM